MTSSAVLRQRVPGPTTGAAIRQVGTGDTRRDGPCDGLAHGAVIDRATGRPAW